jgi:hypothetical protein
MPNYKLIGHNYQTPDIVAKVMGQAKYAEDFRADGMLFCKLLLSPEPHARVRNIDARAALAMKGVAAVLTADEVPAPQPEKDPTGAEEADDGERGLTNEPLFEGEPILAVAAVDELTAAEAIEKINVDLELLPFVIDPLDSLRPGGPDARTQGNIFVPGGGMKTLKWTNQDLQEVAAGRLPWDAKAGEETAWAMSRPGSSRPTSFWTTRSSSSPHRISRSKRARPWPTGRMANFTSMGPHKAWRRRFHSLPRGWASIHRSLYLSANTAGADSAARPSVRTAWPSGCEARIDRPPAGECRSSATIAKA